MLAYSIHLEILKTYIGFRPLRYSNDKWKSIIQKVIDNLYICSLQAHTYENHQQFYESHTENFLHI